MTRVGTVGTQTEHRAAPVEGAIEAWQCIGCGRIEAPQTCIGVCRDRKVLLVGLDQHAALRAERDALIQRLDEVRQALSRFAAARPHAGQWQRSWEALQRELQELLLRLGPG